MAWLTGWSYRKSHVINPASGAGCVTDDALILTPEGLKHPYEIKQGDYVIAHDGLHRVVYNKPAFESPIFEIKLSHGISVKVTRNHRFPTARGIVQAEQLEKGDILFRPFTHFVLNSDSRVSRKFSREALLEYFTQQYVKKKTGRYYFKFNEVDIEKLLNKPITERDVYLAEILGISDAEGKPRRYRTQRSIGYSLNLNISEEERDFLERIKFLCKKLWMVKPKVSKYKTGSKGITVRCGTKAGKELIKYLDLKKKEKFLFRNVALLKAYCNGFLRGDGYVRENKHSISQTKSDLRRIQIYLQLLGFNSSRRFWVEKRERPIHSSKPCYEVKWYAPTTRYVCLKVKEVKRINKPHRIWKLQVEGEHYIVNGILSLNSNYQVRIVAHYGSGTDSGADVYLNGKCRTDFGDIRFTDDDGITELAYWMEEEVDSSYAIFWVKVADDLSTSPATIYIYYGNPSATTTSNGDATFIFFDDFEAGNFNKWTSSGSWQIVTDVVKQGTYAAYCAGGATDRTLRKVLSMTNVLIHVWARAATASGYDGYPIIPLGNTGGLVYSIVFYGGYLKYYQAAYYNWPTNNTYSTNTWYRLEVGYKPATGEQKGWKDRLPLGTIPFHDAANAVVSSLTELRFYSGVSAGQNMWLDVVYVRKYVDPEPSHGAWGAQEAAVFLTESLGLLDVYSRTWAAYRTYSESLGMADYVTKSPTAIKSEILGLSDILVKSSSVIKSESLGLADYYSRTWSAFRVYSELLGLTDYVSKAPSIMKIELLGLLDYLVKASSIIKGESLGLTDYVSKQPAVVKAELLGLSDVYSRLWTLYRVYSESLGLSDVLKKQPAKPFPEVLGLSDYVVKAPSIVKSEPLGLTDYIVKKASMIRAETLGLTDYVAKKPSKTLLETLGLKDYYARRWTLYRMLMENLGLKDYVAKGVVLHPLTEMLGLKDWTAKTLNPLQIYKLADKLRKLIDIKGG